MKRLYILLLLTLPLIAQDKDRILDDLRKLTKTEGFRNYEDLTTLNNAAAYIHEQFSLCSDTVGYQTFKAYKKEYKNVLCSFGPRTAPRLIIGAHYDVCGEQEGADDNATGVVGLLELARLLKDNPPQSYRIDLVAYTLEEPPFFKSNLMGSYIHARYLKNNNIPVIGMVCLEMIGYFSDEKNSQDYPMKFLKLFYGSRGNYITVVRKFRGGSFARKFKRLMKRNTPLPVKGFSAPEKLGAVDMSDHINYWKMGYSALMITDTAFYRNKNYHQTTDTLETLDIHRMALVIQGVYNSLQKFDEKRL